MAVFGICTVRNAADIIAAVVAHMTAQVDEVIVADNLSSDGTRDILAGLPVLLLTDDDPAHRQSEKMTHLARVAAQAGADWVVPFDADEVWTTASGRTVADELDGHTHADVSTAALFDHVTTDTDDATDPDPTRRIRWRRRDPGPLPKVACRTADDLVIADGNHSCTYGQRPYRELHGSLIVHHFPYRSAEQFVAKAVAGAAALELAGRPRSVGAHWRDYAALANARGPAALEAVYWQHFHVTDPAADPTVTLDPL